MLRPHGLKGELRVRGFAEGAPNLQAGRTVYLQSERQTVLRARNDKDAWILQLTGFHDRTQAEGVRGELLETPDAEVRRADAESHFVHELIGLRVCVVGGREIGTVAEILQTGANDVYVVQGPGGEVLIPAIGEVVESIDVARGVISITPSPGLLDESK